MLYDWLNDVGGFNQSIQVIFMLLLPLFKVSSLDQYLIKKLYRTQACQEETEIKT